MKLNLDYSVDQSAREKNYKNDLTNRMKSTPSVQRASHNNRRVNSDKKDSSGPYKSIEVKRSSTDSVN